MGIISIKKKDEDKDNGNWVFRRTLKNAATLIRKPLLVFRVLKSVTEYVKKYDSFAEFTQDIKDEVITSGRMVKAFVKGEYDGITTLNVTMLLAGLLYLVLPIDIVPDFLVGVGLLDDIAILTWIHSKLTTEIEEFKTWEDQQKIQFPIEPIPFEETEATGDATADNL